MLFCSLAGTSRASLNCGRKRGPATAIIFMRPMPGQSWSMGRRWQIAAALCAGLSLLIEADSRKLLRVLLNQDPYIQVGLFADHQLTALHEAAPPLPFGGGK